jgi:hypothetical protein
MDQPVAGHDQEGEGFYRPEGVVVPPTAINQSPAQTPVEATQDVPQTRRDDGTITWAASEYIEHQKAPSWYALLGLVTVALGAVTWLFTHDIVPVVAVMVGVILLGVYGSRKPKQEDYTLDNHGIMVGNRRYLYQDFRSFKVIPDGAFMTIELTPLKRFAVPMTLFFDPADEDQIIGRLSQSLPMEEGSASLTDSVMRRIRF